VTISSNRLYPRGAAGGFWFSAIVVGIVSFVNGSQEIIDNEIRHLAS
jgi:hypothetical protein